MSHLILSNQCAHTRIHGHCDGCKLQHSTTADVALPPPAPFTGLSSHFVMMDDDLFLTAPWSREDFLGPDGGQITTGWWGRHTVGGVLVSGQVRQLQHCQFFGLVAAVDQGMAGVGGRATNRETPAKSTSGQRHGA